MFRDSGGWSEAHWTEPSEEDRTTVIGAPHPETPADVASALYQLHNAQDSGDPALVAQAEELIARTSAQYN